MEKAVDRQPVKSQYQSLRFERKFVYPSNFYTAEDVINMEVLVNGFGFREIYERRKVNNIYFDDCNHTFYKMNVAGDGLRKKYRLRWYDDNFFIVCNPTMEVKKKYGEVGDKYSHRLNGFEMDLRAISLQQINGGIGKAIADLELKSNFSMLFPTLYNSYERRYFLSDCGKFRITIDYNMVFYNPHQLPYHLSESRIDDVILELKYDTKDDMESRKISQQFRERVSKNSKYVRGYEIFHI